MGKRRVNACLRTPEQAAGSDSETANASRSRNAKPPRAAKGSETLVGVQRPRCQDTANGQRQASQVTHFRAADLNASQQVRASSIAKNH